MRVAVIGGAGFMGSNFVRHIAGRGEVLVYDKLTYAGRLENLRGVEVEFVRGDVANFELLFYVLSRFRPDVVVNFAAETHVDRSINDPAPFLTTNVWGVYSVLEAARRLGFLYVHISTDEVYGDLAGGGEADESWPMRPSSPYSASKAAGDLLVQAYGRTYGVRFRIVRPCNNYGPFQHPEKLIPRTIVRLLLGRPATIYGDGRQVRDWLYVGDFVRALEVVIERGVDGGIYNVCAGQLASVREVVERIVSMLGGSVKYVRGRPGEDMRYAMRCDRLRGLGWRPEVSLDEGLRRTVEWYRENEWWWRPVLDEYVLADEPWR